MSLIQSSSDNFHPIYCHFLDRELANFTGYRQTKGRTASLLGSSVLLAEPFSFASLSGVHECLGVHELYDYVLPLLTELGLFVSISDAATAEDFIYSRQLIYRHDMRRYPYYFEEGKRPASLYAPAFIKKISTTSVLVESLVDTISESDPKNIVSGAYLHAAEIVLEALNSREERAITYALFRSEVPKDESGGAVGRIIRRSISLRYSLHHMSTFRGTHVLPGVPHLGQLDEALLMNGPLVPNQDWITRLIHWADPGLNERIKSLDQKSWAEFVEFTISPQGAEFRRLIYQWMSQATSVYGGKVVGYRVLRETIGRIEPRRRWQDNLLLAASELPRGTPRDPEDILQLTSDPDVNVAALLAESVQSVTPKRPTKPGRWKLRRDS